MAIVTTSQNLTAVSYTQGEIIEIRNGATLTINSTPATRPGTIQCITSGKLRIENASTTVPVIVNLQDMDNDLRFEAAGILEIRGAAMPLASGTGAAQTWDFATLFGGVIRHMTYVEVEESAGSGTFMPWPIIAEDPKFNLDVGLNTTIGGATPAAFTAGNTEAGRVLFWHETNRTLRCGNGTQGAVVPSGCAVRIPNIFISNRLLTNQTRSFNIITTGVPTGGTFTIEISRENGTVLGTTAAIPFNATAAQVDTAVEAITGAGTVTNGGGPLPTAVSVTWAGTYVNERLGVRIVTNSLTGGTNPQVYVYESTTSNLSLVDLSPLGTMDAEWVSFSDKFRVAPDVFKAVRLVAVGVGADTFSPNNANGTVEIDGVCSNRSPFVIQAGSQVTSVLGTVSVKRVVSASKTFPLNLSTLPAITTADKLTSIRYGKRVDTNQRSLQFVTLTPGLKITNIVSIGAGIACTNLTNSTVVGYKYADGTLNVQDTLQAVSVMNTSNCANVTFANYSDAGPMAARNFLVSTDSASSVIKVFGATAEGANNNAGMFMNCAGMEISNISLSNLRSNPLLDLPTTFLANNLVARKVFATHGSTAPAAGLDACQGGTYDMVTSTISGITETFNGVNDFVGGNYTEPSLTPTTGHVTFGPFGTGLGLELTGSAFTDALGGIILPSSGDTFVATMPFAMHGVTGFQNVAPFLYVDAPGAIANVALVGNPGNPTGGTFTITVADSAGTVLGTTSALAFNASTATIDTAVEAIAGVGTGVSVTGSMGAGYQITFPTGQLRIVTVNGSSLTGGELPGVAYAVGRARLLTGTELIGSIDTIEFAMRVGGGTFPAYAPLTGANLVSAFAALTGYDAGGAGLEMRVRVTSGQTNPFSKYNQISLPSNVNPSLWSVGDATITLQGTGATDVTKIVRVSDNAVLYTFTGSGTKSFTVGANFNTEVYLRRELASGTVLMVTLPNTQRVNFGNNGTIPLFYGSEIQLAQSSSVDAINTLVTARLDATVSSRLATAGYTAPSTLTPQLDVIQQQASLAAALSA
jgi:hypothetical protein